MPASAHTIDELARELKHRLWPGCSRSPCYHDDEAHDLARLVRRKELEARIDEQQEHGGYIGINRHHRVLSLRAELASLEEAVK
jgi:hypothetical protein